MRFLLLGRHRETGKVSLVSPETYPARQDALDDLGGRVSGSDTFLGHDLFVVDLDVAVPVVIYQAPVPAAEPIEDPIADVWETPAPVDDLPAVSAVEEPEEPMAQPEIPAADPANLADALRRAADHLEAQGIVEPPSVEDYALVPTPQAPEPVEESEPAEAVQAEALVWPWETAALASEAVDAASAVPVDMPAPEASLDVESVPDESPEPDASPEDALEADAPQVFQPVGIDAPGLEEITLLTPTSGDPFDVRPVIVGEYSDAPLAEEESPFSHLESLVTPETAPLEAEHEASVPEAAPSPDPLEETRAYEPGGTDIAAYTCADCVYVSTCPKANQESPATCGSFQWTSV
jgi:hypothetical protein